MLKNVLRTINDEGVLDERSMARRIGVDKEDLKRALDVLALKGYLKQRFIHEKPAPCAGCPFFGACTRRWRAGGGYTLTEKGKRLLEKE